MVARATDSVGFNGDASVADIWVSLPGFPTPREHFGDRPRCIMLEPANLPGDARPIFQQVVGRTHVAFRFTPPPIDRLPAIYPDLRGIVQDGSRQNVFGGNEPLFRFEREDGTVRPVHEIGTLMPNAESSLGDRIVRPKIGDEAVGPPTEFLTLYALLFCLSELARYFPDTWVHALDPDESTAAVTFERGLEIALERAPQLIVVALQGPRQMILDAVVRRLRGEAAVVEEAAQRGEHAAGA
jgi:hypothetical protein